MASSSIDLEAGKCVPDIIEEEEDELFEIDIEAINSIPPPHYWESYFTSTGSALLANCLLPIADVSSAVPTSSTAFTALALAERLMFLCLQQSPYQKIQELLDSNTGE